MKPFILVFALLLVSCSKENPVEAPPPVQKHEFTVDASWKGGIWGYTIVISNMETRNGSVNGSATLWFNNWIYENCRAVGHVDDSSVQIAFLNQDATRQSGIFTGFFADDSTMIGSINGLYYFNGNVITFVKSL